MFKRYDPDAKLVIYYAVIIATHAQRQRIGTNELLIGLTWRQHAQDCAFRKLKDDFQLIWSATGFAHLPLTTIPYKPSKIPLSKQARRALLLAADEADRAGNYWIDIDHIMCGLLREAGSAERVLLATGWTLETVRAAGERGREAHPQKPVPTVTRYRWNISRCLKWLVASEV
jgi:hypothetical protein